MNWLTNLTNWIKEQILAVWTAFKDLTESMFVMWLSNTLTVFAYAIKQIPVPDFITEYTMAELLGSIGPDLAFFFDRLRIAEGFAILGGALVFKVIRKFVTLFQW